MPADNHDPVDIFEASEAHRIRMRNIKAANDMIDMEPDPTLRTVETNEEKPKTDYERFIDERSAAAHLRDAAFRLLGRMEQEISDTRPSPPEGWLENRKEELLAALGAHALNRDQGLGAFEGTQI